MADVEVTIGGDATPFKAAMLQAQTYAKESGARIGESLGLEGLKGERGLRTQVSGFFKDIASGADPATAAMGRLSESFRMTGGAVVAAAAIGFLFETLKSGYEKAEKFRGSVKDALSITGDTTAKSLEQVGEEIDRLKEDVKSTDLGTMSALDAGATVVLQSLDEMKSVGAVVKDDIMEHAAIAAKLHAEEDEAATRSIGQENEILRLKIGGNTEAAAMRADELADANKLLELARQKDAGAIAALKEQIKLKAELREKETLDKGAKALKEQENKARGKIDSTNSEADKEEKKAAFDALSLPEKIATLTKRIHDSEELRKNPNASPQQKADLRLVIAQTKDQLGPLQKEENRDESEKAAKKKGLSLEKRKLQERVRAGGDELRSRQGEALGYHGQVDSMRREGFAGRAGPNQNNEALKHAAETAASVKDMLKEMTALNQKIDTI